MEINKMSTYIIISLVSLIVGGGSTLLIVKKKEEPVVQPVATENIATEQQEVIKQLTNTDLLAVPCSQEFIQENKSDILCREMFCRMMTRGIDAQTGGKECEEISNLANSLSIISSCEELEDRKEECYEIYFRRK